MGFSYFIILRARATVFSKIVPWALLAKMLAVIGAAVFNLYFISGDSQGYLHDLKTLNEVFSISPKAYFELLYWKETSSNVVVDLYYFEDSRPWFLMQLLSPLYLLVRDYWAMCLYLGLLSFIGFYFLAGRLVAFNGNIYYPAVFALFFMPSVLFWTSGLMKEPLAITFMSILIGYFICWKQTKVYEWMVSLLLMFLLLKLKYYYGALLLPVLLTYIFVEFISPKKYKLIYASLVLTGLLLLATFLHPNLSLEHIYSSLKQNYTSMAVNTSAVVEYDFGSSFISLIPYTPKAIFTGLFRPFPFVDKPLNIYVIFAMLENVFLLFMSVVAIVKVVRGKIVVRVSLEGFLAGIYVFLASMLIAFSCSNLGSLHRYRIGYLFVFLLIVFSASLKNVKKPRLKNGR